MCNLHKLFPYLEMMSISLHLNQTLLQDRQPAMLKKDDRDMRNN